METEGVIKFELDYTQAPPLAGNQIALLNGWRRIFYLSGLIGQDQDRYGGYGYGNISRRIEPYEAPPNKRRFIISGSQTGHLPEINTGHYAVVETYDPNRHQVSAHGPIKPSSESLSHGVIYDLIPSARCVIHAHSPDIWNNAHALNIPITSPSATYGSMELVDEIKQLLKDQSLKIFSMGGHEDGIVAFGTGLSEAGCLLISTLAQALSV
jgi:hypothetical protein